MTVLLTRKAVLQAALETVFNTPQSVGVNDGFLISNPMFSIQPNVLERNFVRNDLSPMPIIIGRKLAKMEFETELRSNGLSNLGLSANAPLITRLFQACGYTMTQNPGPCVIGPYDFGHEPGRGLLGGCRHGRARDRHLHRHRTARRRRRRPYRRRRPTRCSRR